MYRVTNNNILQGKKLIESIWILDKKSGICLFEENLHGVENKTNFSADLASAFISAIATFVDETFSDGIQNIEFKKRKLFFRFTSKLLFVFVFSKSTKMLKHEQERLMNKVVKKFNNRFGHNLGKKLFISRTSNFNGFSEDLAEIMRPKLPKENMINFIRYLKEKV